MNVTVTTMMDTRCVSNVHVVLVAVVAVAAVVVHSGDHMAVTRLGLEVVAPVAVVPATIHDAQNTEL
jgi:hypothetical protein